MNSPSTETHLVVLDAVEDEDEDSLQSVEDGKDVSHHHGCVVEVQQSKGPREAQQEHEDHGASNPRPEIPVNIVMVFLKGGSEVCDRGSCCVGRSWCCDRLVFNWRKVTRKRKAEEIK